MYDFDKQEQDAYIHKILERFSNPYLTDDVKRVGRSPIRKLSPNDRLVKPALLGFERELPVDHLVQAIVAALKFDDLEDSEAIVIQKSLREKGIREVVTEYLGIAEEHPLHVEIVQKYDRRDRK